ncbi:ABC transporter permease [Bacteroidales bacterium OttesenSCG-928-J19]|nr:ABC transporter permease [Bacteroidales bacterium OttesenSCG-928-J19]
MKTEYFIAKRILFSQGEEKKVSPPAIRIAVASMALGIVVMILAVGIVVGFKQEVADKVVGFGSHIQVSSMRNANSYETNPVSFSPGFLDSLSLFPNVKQIEKVATIPGIIKTDEDFLGIIIKGVDEDYDWSFFQSNLKEGNLLSISPDSTTNRVIISQSIADKLNLNLGDAFNTFFVQEPIRARKYTIAGIYQTGFSDYDDLFILADIKQIRRLNGWDASKISGLELLVTDYSRLDETAENLYLELAGKTDNLGNALYVRSIKEQNPMIFEWLSVLDLNVVLILVLMLVVAGFSMISGLLIIIIERANMIGILKALGENNASIRKIFLIVSAFLIGKGLLWGNLIALGIAFLQKATGIFTLDPATYYLSEVPIHLNIWSILAINLGTLLVTLLVLLGPSYLIAKISPAKTIRFE